MTDKITHALLSVSDKEGVIDLAKGLIAASITLLSTGGTARLLREANIPVQDIADFTGFPEMMDGRVKTLHPRLFGGILARGQKDSEVLAKHQIPTIGLVVVNLYPFQQVIAKEDCSLETAIENIDIGGPSLLRAAAKNYQFTTAVVSKDDYPLVLKEIKAQGTTCLETRFTLAKKVFAHVAQYDAAISHYLATFSEQEALFPPIYTLQLTKQRNLRYGENPHQRAAFYQLDIDQKGSNISTAMQQSGKPLSYNNIVDADTALECVKQFKETACVIVKHANPCAVSLGSSQLVCYQKAFSADSTSAFGGIIAFNTKLESVTMDSILKNQFVELLIAPEISQAALDLVKQKPNVRILTVGDLVDNSFKAIDFKNVTGGILLQERDNLPSPLTLDVVTTRSPTEQEQKDLLFSWQVVRFVKSNAIVLAKDNSTIGIGSGQMSRVWSTKIACLKADASALSVAGAVLASDAFFPFRDSIDEAATLGITAIIQPGGSIRDDEVIAAANEHQIAMIFTHIRHFRH